MVFLRPGMGFFAGLLLSRVIKKPNAPLTKILRAGSWLYLGGWLFLLVAVSLPDEFVQVRLEYLSQSIFAHPHVAHPHVALASPVC